MEPEAIATSSSPSPMEPQSASGEPTPAISWEASEFVQHDKPLWWYAALLGLMVVLSGVLELLHQLLTIALVVVMTVAVAIWSRKQPRTLRYTLDAHGITIQTKLLTYSHFRSYSLHKAVSWQEVELEPAKRFAPRLTLLVSNENFDAIEHTLSLHLPKVERSHDLIERLARSIKF